VSYDVVMVHETQTHEERQDVKVIVLPVLPPVSLIARVLNRFQQIV